MTGASRVALVTGAGTRAGHAIAGALRNAACTVTTERDEPVRTLDLAVYALPDPATVRSRPLVEVDEDGWVATCEAPLREFVGWLQSVHEPLAARAGTAVLVAPTASQEGATGLVPYTTAVEGQRLLAKSVARQWASQGVTVLTVAPRFDALVDPADVGDTDAGRTEPSLPDREYGPDAIARVVAMLVAPAARALNGATIPVDGGALLAP